MCKIAILENYSLFCSGIRPVLEKINEFEIVAEAKYVMDLLPLLKETKPDLVIIDVLHCDQDGIIQVNKIKRKLTKIPILLIVNEDYANHFEDYISLGINGLVFGDSNAKKLITAVKTLKRGEDFFPNRVWLLIKNILRKKHIDKPIINNDTVALTRREISVLQLFCKGYTYKEIGASLHISPRTVETHKKNITTKLGVKSTAEMVEYAFKKAIV